MRKNFYEGFQSEIDHFLFEVRKQPFKEKFKNTIDNPLQDSSQMNDFQVKPKIAYNDLVYNRGPKFMFRAQSEEQRA